MERLALLCLVGMCLLTPLVFALLTGGMYALGVGAMKVPGIARREMRSDKEWTTVPILTRKATEIVAAVVSLAGALLGLVGFLLPWVSVNIGAVGAFFDFGGLNGTLTGIALPLQSFIVGFGLLSSDFQELTALAGVLIAVALLVTLIPLALLLSAAIGVGLISVPLGLFKANFQRLSRGLLVMSALSLCLLCAFFAGLQATVGGVQVGGSENIFGSSFSIGVRVANGFWITVGGLVLALIGAIAANTLAAALENWVQRLTKLEEGLEKAEAGPTS